MHAIIARLLNASQTPPSFIALKRSMAIYGTAILALCSLAGLFVGELLGSLLKVNKNIGGVGIAMVLLIVTAELLRRSNRFREATESGISYWSAIYVPIVVAIAATQNVYGAIHAGPMAILAGVVTVVGSMALVPLVSRIAPPKSLPPEDR